MVYDEIFKLAEHLEKKMEQSPSMHAEKELKNREVKEKVKDIKSLADVLEKKYFAAKSMGFIGNFSVMRDLNKAKSNLEDAIKILEKAN